MAGCYVVGLVLWRRVLDGPIYCKDGVGKNEDSNEIAHSERVHIALVRPGRIRYGMRSMGWIEEEAALHQQPLVLRRIYLLSGLQCDMPATYPSVFCPVWEGSTAGETLLFALVISFNCSTVLS